MLAFLMLVLSLHAQEPKFQVKIDYSYSADVFEFMDNVSAWWPGFTEDEFRKYWDSAVTVDPMDKKFFEDYKKIRQKYYQDPGQKEKDPTKAKNGFFMTDSSLTADPLGNAFHASNTLDEAYLSLEKIVTAPELETLKSFYSHFEARFKPILQDDAQKFSGSIAKVRKSYETKGMVEYFGKVAAFYGVKADFSYRVVYTWWPPVERTNANPAGSFLIMRNNPEKHADRNDSDIVAHEIIHTISARQDVAQKKSLTETFLKKCPVEKDLRRYEILEEPLSVVFGQMLYLQKFFPSYFSEVDKLYNNPWVNVYSRLIFPVVKNHFEKGEVLGIGVIDDVASLCSDLSLLSKPKPAKK